MKSVTTWGDILAGNVWINLHSRLNWLVSVPFAASVAIHMTLPRLQQEGQSMTGAVVAVFMVFVMIMIAIALTSGVLLVLVAGANFFRKGALGPKTFTMTAEALIEDDGRQVTTVAWRKIRTIGKTRRHIFVRISRWQIQALSARDFEHEYQFVQYYADLLKAKHEGTKQVASRVA